MIATPRGIKQEFPVFPKAPAHLRWSSRAVKGLVYMVTDKGPQQQTPQNAAHLLGCPLVGDGRGRTSEQIWEDEKWCEAVADFIM